MSAYSKVLVSVSSRSLSERPGAVLSQSAPQGSTMKPADQAGAMK